MRRCALLPTAIAALAIGAVAPAVARADERAETDPAGFNFQLLGAHFSVAPVAILEADYRVFPGEEEGETGFALGRLRLGTRFGAGKWLRVLADVDFVGGEGPSVSDAYAEFRPNDWMEVTAGYSRPPLFPEARLELEHLLPFGDLAPVVESFRVRRDLGAEIRLHPHVAPVEGIVRIGNGSGSVLGPDDPVPAGYASLDLVLGRAWSGLAHAHDRFGLRLGAAGLVESVRDRDSIEGTTPIGFVFYRPTVVEGRRLVGEAHLVGYAGPFTLNVAGSFANEERSKNPTGDPNAARVPLPSLDSRGVTAELSFVAFGAPRRVGIAPQGRGFDHWNGGALELAARFDRLWLGLDAADVKPGGAVGGALSLRWWATNFLSATAEGYALRYDSPPIEEPTRSISVGLLTRLSFFWGLGYP